MKLLIVSPAHVDQAWADGASNLAEACKWAGREITPDQLKMMLAENRRTLLALDDGGKKVAWAAVRVEQLPNLRVFYIYSIYAPGATGPVAFELLAGMARNEGCSVIRGACSEPVCRLWEKKLNAKRLYTICEIEVPR